jgi:hypothetical protein
MNRQLLEKQWRDYTEMLSFDGLVALIEPMEEFCGQQIELLLPSARMGTTGPVLATVFATTRDFISELAVAEKPDCRFDLIERSAATRFALNVRQFELAQPEGPPRNFRSATLEVIHGPQGVSEPTFIGDDLKAWLEQAKTMFPVAMLLRK